MLRRQLHHCIEIKRIAKGVRHHNCPSLRSNGFRQTVDVNIVRSENGVDEDRHKPVLQNGVDGCWEASGNGQHLVAFLQAALAEPGGRERCDRQQICR